MLTDKKRSKKPSRLGRGLTSLMTGPVEVAPPAEPETVAHQDVAVAPPTSAADQARRTTTTGDHADELSYLPVESIRRNPHQPRQQFNPASLERLAESIHDDGIMQPVVVRPVGNGDKGYELVAGERRLRAAQQAGLDRIPAIVRQLDDRQVTEWSLIENLQREDLNPIERAEAFQSLIERFGLSHEQVAQRVGLDRSSVTNALRLLHLHESMQQLVRDGLLSLGQAKALAGLADRDLQAVLAKRAAAEGWSVRQVEAAVRTAGDGAADTGSKAPTTGRADSRPALLRDLEEQIGRQ
ncbi:MAG: ParB/RepB/Spo0J family partition protein, partial [Phycisphaeraceae bacterium]